MKHEQIFSGSRHTFSRSAFSKNFTHESRNRSKGMSFYPVLEASQNRQSVNKWGILCGWTEGERCAQNTVLLEAEFLFRSRWGAELHQDLTGAWLYIKQEENKGFRLYGTRTCQWRPLLPEHALAPPYVVGLPAALRSGEQSQLSLQILGRAKFIQMI